MAPFSTAYSIATNGNTADYTKFIIGSVTSPTASAGSYVRWQQIGCNVTVEFKYIFATVGSGNFTLTLPVPINANYPKPQSIFHIRYITGGGQVHYGFYNENNSTSISAVAQTTFGGVPANLTTASPNTLNIADIMSGVIMYETC